MSRQLERPKVCRGLGRLTAIAALAALFAGVAAIAPGDDVPPPKIHPLFVDADNPSAWPKRLEPVSAAELLRLLGPVGGHDSTPAAAQIERAVYQATFRDGRLCDGKAHFVITHSGAAMALVPLGDPSLDLTHPHWIVGDESPNAKSKTEDALWGSDSTGRRVLIAEPGRSQLTCDWSLAGRSLLSATDFTLVLPPSVVSQVLLSVPDQWTIDCSTGVVSTANSPRGRGETVWQIDLGGRSSCRVRIDRKLGPAAKPAVFVDQDTAYFVSAEKLQIQSKLQLEVFSSPLTSFSLTVPSGLRVETISCADVPLAFESHAAKDIQEIDVALPEPLVGKGRSIVVEASTVSRTNQMWSLPRIDVPGAVRRDGQVELTSANPLILLQFGGEAAIAQLEAPSYAADGEETFKLRDADHERPILIEVGEPTPTLTASMLQRLDLLRDQCVLRCDVVCAASGGSTFSVECELPDAWDITNVQAVGDVSRIIHWASRAAAAHKRRVTIDFFRAVTEREPQRFRIEAARPVPRTGETIDLPVLWFPGLRTGDLQTVVTHSPAIDLALDPPNEFVPLDQAVISAPFADSSLLPDAHTSSEERIVVHQRTPPNEKARITLRRGEQGFVARVQTTVDMGTSQMTQRIAASVTPQTGPLDRLFVYLTSEGPPLTWLLVSDRPRPLDASRIAPSRHSEWNLPVGGELWEIRIPDPQRQAFRLEGSRKTSSLGSGGIGLAFLPGARSFSGTVDVRFDDARQFEVEVFGPRPVRSSDEHLPVDVRGENRVVRTWNYERPTDSLVVKPRQSDSQQILAQVAALDLHSYLYSGGTGDDLHKAVFSLAPLPGTRPFRFSLDVAARLSSVAVNGRVVRVQHHGDTVTVPSLPSERWNRVEIVYKTSSIGHAFREDRPVVIPRADDAEVFQFRWWFALPPGIQPCGNPVGTRLTEKLPALSWTEKLFGPLGRPKAESQIPAFADAPWMTDFGFDSYIRPDVFAEIDPDRPAPNWTVWHASADVAPRVLAISVWHEPEMRGLAWIVFLGCLSAGFVFQRWNVRFRKPLRFAIVAAAAATALVVPGLYSLPLGACVSGTFLSILVWGTWFTRPATAGTVKGDRSRLGSTVSFQYRPIVVLLAIGVAFTAAAWGADTSSQEKGPVPAPNARPPASRAASPSDLLVVIPTHGGSAAASQPLTDDERLLYVPRGALETLRRTRGQRQEPDTYVLLSSHYAVAFDAQQAPTVEARFRVAVTSPDATSIRLPLSNVTLAGADACRVNGRPHPVRKTEEACVLTLPGSAAEESRTGPAIESDQPRRPVEAARPESKGGKKPVAGPPVAAPGVSAVPRPRIYEILLSFFPGSNGTMGSAGYEFGVPKMASAQLQVLKPGPAAPMTVQTENGRIRTLAAGAVTTIELGEAELLRFVPGPVSASPSPVLEGRAVQFVRVSPELIEMDCRVTYAASRGEFDDLEWMIPAAAVARASGDDFRIARGAPTADGRWAPLKFALSARPEGPLTLGVKLMIPVRAVPVLGRPPHFVIPLVRFAGRSGAGGVRLLSSQIGVTAVPGYRAAVATNESNLSHTTAADPAFRQEWHGGGRKEPEFILESHGLSALPVELAPLVPSHKVRISNEARFSADRLLWKTTAEIRVENAPAFVHLLHVDRRLNIESISIQEDNVERLVRYSRSGEDVTLFLRDRAAATQDLVLSGSMPVELGREMKLPTVSLVGATFADARLMLQPDAQVDLAVINGPKPLAAVREEPGDDRALRRTREYLLAPDAALPQVRITQRTERPRLTSVTVLASEGPQMVDVGVYLRFSGTRGEEGPFEITIPQELAARSKIVANVEKQVRRHADGTFGVLLEAHSANEPVVQIHWLQALRGETWTIPSLSATNAATSEAVLLISDSIAWRPGRDFHVATSPPDAPEWMRRWLPAGQTFNSWKSAEGVPANWVLTRTSATPARQAAARIYVSLALSADGSKLGSLFVLVQQQSEPTLTIHWPHSAVLRAALLDGQPVQPISEKEGRLAFPVGPEGRTHRLAIHWAVAAGRPLSTAEKVSEEIPLPIDLDAKTMLLAVSIPSGFRILSPASFQAIGPSLFADESRAIATPQGQTTGDEGASPAAAPSFASGVGHRLLGQLAITQNSTSIEFWTFRESLVTIPVAIGVFAVVFVVLLGLPAFRPAVWLAHRQPLMLAIVGTAWWLCLSPRAVGVAAVVASLVWFATRQRARRSRGRDTLPSTVHLPA
jgi:hypothetical protein